jgi:peptidoglycan/xylan/chitin deacetylase (PgdA/CDA1 family)
VTAPTEPQSPTFVSAGPRTKPLVALTFHVSGDRNLAVTLLDLLQQHHTPITAFMVGTFVDQNPEIVRRLVSDGHEVANHTYTHPTFASLTRQQMSDEVTRCRDALATAARQSGRFFRASGTANGTDPPTATELDVAMAAGYPTMLGYDVDPADYADPGATVVAARVADGVQPGSIVSLHFGHQGTIDALPSILDTLTARSLGPVTASTLLNA